MSKFLGTPLLYLTPLERRVVSELSSFVSQYTAAGLPDAGKSYPAIPLLDSEELSLLGFVSTFIVVVWIEVLRGRAQ